MLLKLHGQPSVVPAAVANVSRRAFFARDPEMLFHHGEPLVMLIDVLIVLIQTLAVLAVQRLVALAALLGGLVATLVGLILAAPNLIRCLTISCHVGSSVVTSSLAKLRVPVLAPALGGALGHLMRSELLVADGCGERGRIRDALPVRELALETLEVGLSHDSSSVAGARAWAQLADDGTCAVDTPASVGSGSGLPVET